MKKVSLYIWIFALALSTFCSERGLSAVAVNHSSTHSAYPSLHLALSSSSILNAPLRLVFPYESFNHAVCRKPSFLLWNRNNFDQYYLHRVELNIPSNPANFTRVGQNLLFQNGNSYLSIPQTLTLRLNNNFQPIPNPTLNLKKPD